jgi:oligopeptide transport system ATP-binding protein
MRLNYYEPLLESGRLRKYFIIPCHETPRAFCASFPNINNKTKGLFPIAGTPINLLNMPKGCASAHAAYMLQEICLEEIPRA